MLLSATLIARDEARHLGTCLQSVRDLVDEVVVVDTGSADDSREIARAHGATVVETTWCDDFAAPRNLALDHARGAWVLYIDADERVVRAQGVRHALAAFDEDVVAGLVRFRVQSGFTRYWEYRLLRRSPDIRFRGVIHETPVPDILEQVKKRGAKVVETGLAMDHLGYDGDRTHKYRRDLPLLMRAVKHDPDRLYLWYALGVAWLGVGDAGRAARAWSRGVDVLEASPRRPETGLLLIAALAGQYLDQNGSAASIIDDAAQYYPDHPLTWWLQARQAVIQRRYAQAIPILLRLAGTDPERVDRRISMDTRIFRECAYELLGTCLIQEGDPAGAVKWLGMAEEASIEPHAGLTIKRRFAEARLARAGA